MLRAPSLRRPALSLLLRSLTFSWLVVAGLSACGGGSSDGTTEPPPPPPPPPPPAAVARVTLAAVPERMTLGARITLQATATDASGNVLTGRATSWRSSNSEVASVSSTGDVTAFALGAATITVTVESASASATITVAPLPVARVRITAPTLSVNEGRTVSLSAATLDSAGRTLTDRSVAWASRNTAVATVSSAGVVTGVSQGAVVIAATSEGIRDSVTITVAAPLPPSLAFDTAPPAGVLPGRAFRARVRTVDGRTGAPVLYTGPVVATLVQSSTGNLVGTTTVQAQNGVAIFDNLALMQNGSWQLRFAATGYEPLVSGNITVGANGNGTITISTPTVARPVLGTTTTATYSFTATVRDLNGVAVAAPTMVNAEVVRGNAVIVSGGSMTTGSGGTATMQISVRGSGTFDLLLSTPDQQTGTHAMATLSSTAAFGGAQRFAPDSVVAVGATFQINFGVQVNAQSPLAVHSVVMEMNWSPDAFELVSDSTVLTNASVTLNRSGVAEGVLRATVAGTDAIATIGRFTSMIALRFRVKDGDGIRGVQRIQVHTIEARGPLGELFQERVTSETTLRVP
ncbi:MAG: Ig-like domain-containing protein [Gemmatimonadaceae bacterium]|nr:Ig-like domain-containing protein [Gemmatimonadaceae bacterium]